MKDRLIAEAKEKMSKTVSAIGRELSGIRTGKASATILDGVKVEAYGASMPINQVATVSVPEARLIVVQAFDKSTVGDIVKGIQIADLGLNPVVDGQIIRLPIPPLNEERRKDLVKRCKHIAEEGRVAVRNVRRDANDHIKKAEKDKELSEDNAKDAMDEVQELTDEHIKEIDHLLEKKEKDMMEV
jgi:ribosome recycling factor